MSHLRGCACFLILAPSLLVPLGCGTGSGGAPMYADCDVDYSEEPPETWAEEGLVMCGTSGEDEVGMTCDVYLAVQEEPFCTRWCTRDDHCPGGYCDPNMYACFPD
jgi:hypothetical protein